MQDFLRGLICRWAFIFFRKKVGLSLRVKSFVKWLFRRFWKGLMGEVGVLFRRVREVFSFRRRFILSFRTVQKVRVRSAYFRQISIVGEKGWGRGVFSSWNQIEKLRLFYCRQQEWVLRFSRFRSQGFCGEKFSVMIFTLIYFLMIFIFQQYVFRFRAFSFSICSQWVKRVGDSGQLMGYSIFFIFLVLNSCRNLFVVSLFRFTMQVIVFINGRETQGLGLGLGGIVFFFRCLFF